MLNIILEDRGGEGIEKSCGGHDNHIMRRKKGGIT